MPVRIARIDKKGNNFHWKFKKSIFMIGIITRMPNYKQCETKEASFDRKRAGGYIGLPTCQRVCPDEPNYYKFLK